MIKNSKKLLVIGTGALASYMIDAHCSVRPIEEVLIWGRNKSKIRDIIKSYDKSKLKFSLVSSLDEACGIADIITSITSSKKAFIKAISTSKKKAMSLSDQFCVKRHKKSFFDLVNNKLDIVFANEQEVLSLIDTKSFDEVISFGKQLGKLLVITRGAKGSIAIQKNEVVECDSQKDLKITDLTGAGDLFAAGFLHGHINNLSIKESLEKGTEMSSKIIQKIGARLN